MDALGGSRVSLLVSSEPTRPHGEVLDEIVRWACCERSVRAEHTVVLGGCRVRLTLFFFIVEVKSTGCLAREIKHSIPLKAGVCGMCDGTGVDTGVPHCARYPTRGRERIFVVVTCLHCVDRPTFPGIRVCSRILMIFQAIHPAYGKQRPRPCVA